MVKIKTYSSVVPPPSLSAPWPRPSVTTAAPPVTYRHPRSPPAGQCYSSTSPPPASSSAPAPDGTLLPAPEGTASSCSPRLEPPPRLLCVPLGGADASFCSGASHASRAVRRIWVETKDPVGRKKSSQVVLQTPALFQTTGLESFSNLAPNIRSSLPKIHASSSKLEEKKVRPLRLFAAKMRRKATDAQIEIDALDVDSFQQYPGFWSMIAAFVSTHSTRHRNPPSRCYTQNTRKTHVSRISTMIEKCGHRIIFRIDEKMSTPTVPDPPDRRPTGRAPTVDGSHTSAHDTPSAVHIHQHATPRWRFTYTSTRHRHPPARYYTQSTRKIHASRISTIIQKCGYGIIF